ncbi:MAG: sugar transferase [Cyanobacteria bacterium J06650_10]
MGINQTIQRIDTSADLRAQKFSVFRRGAPFVWFRILSLVVLDALLLALDWWIANRLGTPTISPWRLESNPYAAVPVICIVIFIIAAKGLYAAGEKRRDYQGLFKAVVLGNGLLLLTAFFYEPEQFISRSHFLLFFILSIVSTCFSHFLIDTGINWLRRKGVISYPVFLIADPQEELRSLTLINQEKRYFVSGKGNAQLLDRDNRGKTFDRLKKLGVSEVFVTWSAIERRPFVAWHFQSRGITLRILPEKKVPLFQTANLWMIGGVLSLSFDPAILTGVNFRLKKIFDFVCSLIILTLASPLYVAIAIAIKQDSSGPIFYRQTRIGLHGQPFKAWKFRSMVTNADKMQKELEEFNKNKDGILFKIEDDPRITRVGKFLRKYSLDELPQIFNVLAGEMSLVGPRPLPVRDVEQFSEHHFIRHEVLPGITGLWQVSGRSDIDDFEDVLRLDLSYIENWSLWLDFSILLQTVRVVFQKSGAY